MLEGVNEGIGPKEKDRRLGDRRQKKRNGDVTDCGLRSHSAFS
jgi:hypothetical protein